MNDQPAPPRRGVFGAALAGGVVGSVATAALLLVAAPALISSKIVRQGLLADPAILPDTVEALRDSQYTPALDANRTALETPFASSWKGTSKPDVTLVEFFDYACPYCKASNPFVDRLLKEDHGLRVVYRELPILGPDSVAAARVSLAASKLGRFARFHDDLWAAGRPSEATISAAAQSSGLPATLSSDPQVEAELKQNFQLAGKLGATGTPLFIVGAKVMNGAVGYDTLKQAIATARKDRN